MELVQSLLAGEPVDTAELDYEFKAWHLGVIATGNGAEKAVRGLANGLGCQLLRVVCGEGMVWAWFGGQHRLAVADIERLLTPNGTAGVSLTIGESRRGTDGWRLTHREAQAALVVTLRRPQMLTRCTDVPLEAAVLWHEVLARSLVGTYLSPLANMKDGGAVSRNTLRAYFNAGRNAATAAVVLKVNRHTVERRLHRIEKALGRLIPACHAELEIALRLEELGYATGTENIPYVE
jgi:sugar diacid utilization regulator